MHDHDDFGDGQRQCLLKPACPHRVPLGYRYPAQVRPPLGPDRCPSHPGRGEDADVSPFPRDQTVRDPAGPGAGVLGSERVPMG